METFWHGVIASLSGGIISGIFALFAVKISLKEKEKDLLPKKIEILSRFSVKLILIKTYCDMYLEKQDFPPETNYPHIQMNDGLTILFEEWTSLATQVDRQTYHILDDLSKERRKIGGVHSLYDLYLDNTQEKRKLEEKVEKLSTTLNKAIANINIRKQIYEKEIKYK